jgi:hypothetical protein
MLPVVVKPELPVTIQYGEHERQLCLFFIARKSTVTSNCGFTIVGSKVLLTEEIDVER